MLRYKEPTKNLSRNGPWVGPTRAGSNVRWSALHDRPFGTGLASLNVPYSDEMFRQRPEARSGRMSGQGRGTNELLSRFSGSYNSAVTLR